jgi:hypothetical protein
MKNEVTKKYEQTIYIGVEIKINNIQQRIV